MKNLTYFIFIFILTITTTVVGQYVTTVANGSCLIQGIAIDDTGNIYWTERSNCNIVKKMDVFSRITNYTSPFSGDPTFMVLNKGWLYISLYGGNKIVRVPPGGGSIQDYVTGCSSPAGLVFDGDTLFFVEYFSQRVYKVLPGGGAVGSSKVIAIQNTINGVAGSGVRLVGLELLPNRNLVTTTFYDGGNFYEINRNTGQSTVIHTSPSTDVASISRGPDNYYYYTGYYTHKIYKVNSSFSQLEIFAGSTAGSDDGHISNAKFSYPYGIKVSTNGDIFVSEYISNNRLRRISEVQTPRRDIINISVSGIFDCPNNGLQFVFVGVTGSGVCTLSVLSNSYASNINFSGTAPTYLTRYRMIINFSGFQFLNGYLRLPIQYILNMGYTSAQHLRAFYRQNIGTGSFTELSWTVDPTNQNYILITLTGSGEIIFGSNYPLQPTSVENGVITHPSDFELYQNYPNPFNPSTTIKFYLPKTEFIRLKVFDAYGREIRALINSTMNAGYHEINFDASNLSSGVYLYRLEVNSKIKTKKMLLIK